MSKKKISKEKKAAKILAANPHENKVFITKDGQPFFINSDALNHCRRKGITQEPEVFFRQGFEDKDPEVDQTLLDEIETLKAELRQSKDANDALKNENETLKAELQESKDANDTLKAENETLIKQLPVNQPDELAAKKPNKK